ncbi:MAG: LysM domain-containing protein, partial [Spirochaetales bacterium]
FARYFSDLNGRPLNPETKNDKDLAKVEKLTPAEKAMLVDVRSGATMSLNDAHGAYLAALKSAWDNRKPLVK